MSSNPQLLPVNEEDVEDEMKLRRLVQEKVVHPCMTNAHWPDESLQLRIAKVSLDPTPLNQHSQYPWTSFENNVCAALINLGSKRGRISITDRASYQTLFEIDTGEEKKGHVIFFRQPGQREIIAAGAEVRCFRR